MYHIFIVNPFTCKEKTSILIDSITSICKSTSTDYRIFTTEYIGHATELVQQNYTDEVCCVYAVGGDGTAYEVANGLKNGQQMAIIPAGTSNDFYRMLEIKSKNMNEIIEATLFGKTVHVDYGICNQKLFLNTTTLGLDARVNATVCNLLKKLPLPRFLLYGFAAVANILEPQPFLATVETPETKIETKSILIAVMNGKYYGNGFTPTKNANIQDGLLDICIVHSTPILKMLYLLPKYFRGNTLSLVEVTHVRCSKVNIKTNSPVHIQSDGENSMTSECSIELKNKQLNLRVPKTAILN